MFLQFQKLMNTAYRIRVSDNPCCFENWFCITNPQCLTYEKLCCCSLKLKGNCEQRHISCALNTQFFRSCHRYHTCSSLKSLLPAVIIGKAAGQWIINLRICPCMLIFSASRNSLKSSNLHGWASKFPRDADRLWLPPWAFRSAKHGWKYFLTLNSFPAHIRNFKNLKGNWHQNVRVLCPLAEGYIWQYFPFFTLK